MKYANLVRRLESRLGPVHEITQIKKGFSQEEKYLIKTKLHDYLLRISPAKAYARKKEEFEVMEKAFAKDVSCNRPIDMFMEEEKIYSLFTFLPGHDAEDHINELPESTQFEIGFRAGQDLKKINTLENHTESWKEKKLIKHEQYLKKYRETGYRFDNDEKVLKFIELNYDRIKPGPDKLQHDDFHLGNIVINNGEYSGILDFNRYDWGDPLHEFVKLEWFTWPVSRAFARGEIKGYFGDREIGTDTCLILSVYIAMSIFSTIVWTLKFYPDTMSFVDKRVDSILTDYDCFDRIRPQWII